MRRARALRTSLALATFLLGWSVGMPAAAGAPKLRIGVEAPLSGPDARFGNQIVLGVARATADANAQGGLLGHELQTVPRDDGADPKRGVEVAKGFIADKIPIVVGPFSSAVAVPASAAFAEAGVVDITPSATAPLVTDRGLSTLFRLCGREDAQAGVAARYLAEHDMKVAIVFDRTSEGKALADAVRAALVTVGRKDVFYGSFAKGTANLLPLVQRMRSAGAQAVFVGAGGADAGALARAIHDAGGRITVMGGIPMATDDFAAAAGAGADGTLIVFPRDPRTRPSAADLLRRLSAAGESTEAYVFYAYAAVQVLRQAAQTAGSLEPRAIAAAMHTGGPFATVLGDLTFDAKGNVEPSDAAVYVWHKGASGRMAFDDLAKS